MTLPADYLDQLRGSYPKRDGGQGLGAVPRLVAKAIADGATWETILLGVQNYAIHCARKGIAGTEYVMQLRTFVGRDAHYEEFAVLEVRSPAQIASVMRLEAATRKATAAGFRSPRLNEPLEVYESCLRDHEREQTRGVGQPKFQVVR